MFHSFQSHIEALDPSGDMIIARGKESGFRLLHMDVQFSQHHVLEGLSSLQCPLLVSIMRISWLQMCRSVSGIFCPVGLCVCFYIRIAVEKHLKLLGGVAVEFPNPDLLVQLAESPSLIFG